MKNVVIGCFKEAASFCTLYPSLDVFTVCSSSSNQAVWPHWVGDLQENCLFFEHLMCETVRFHISLRVSTTELCLSKVHQTGLGLPV